jgi:Tol biopolymer transport system component
MLTGARLFEGDTDSDILLAVMQEDPDWQALPPKTPPAVRRLLRRCLERNRNKRLHHIADARLEIEDACTQPDEPPTQQTQPDLIARVRTVWPALLAAVAITAVLTGGIVRKLSGFRTAAPNFPARVALPVPPGVTINTIDWGPALAMSPGGRVLVFAGKRGDDRQLFSRSLEQFHATPIPGTEGGSYPFFSPDGLWLGFIADGKIKKVAVAGGPPQIIADAPNCLGATWGPRGAIVFNPYAGSGLSEVPAVGGTPEALLTPDYGQGGWSFSWPEFLPDGNAVLFTSFRGETADTNHVEVFDLESRTRKTLVEGANYARYFPTGHLVFGRGKGVHAAPFDAERRVITGPSVPVPDPIFYDFEIGLFHLAFSASGSLAFIPGGGPIRRRLVSVDLEGRATPLIDGRRGYMYPRFSPDGERLAVTISEPEDTNVWVVDMANQTHTKLTLEGANVFPSWTPDGERVTYLSHREGLYSVSWNRADGSGHSEPLVAPEDVGEWVRDGSWSPDGKTFVYATGKPSLLEHGFDIWISPLGGDHEPRPMVSTTGAVEFGPVVSPDGRWLAYVSDISGRHEIYVQPFPDGGARHQISTDGGWKPVWSPSGRSIYFRFGNQILATPVSTTPRFRAGAARVLFEGEFQEGSSFLSPNFDIAPDGKSFVMVKPDEEWGRATEIRVIFNWFEELERLAPATGIR